MKRIQTKIMMMVVTAILGVSIISSVQSIIITQSSTMETIEQLLEETTELAASSAQNMISTYTLTIGEIAANSILSDDTLTPEEKQAFLQTRADAYSMRFAGLADSTGYDSYHDVDISDTVFFQEAMKGRTYMTTPYVEKNDTFLVIASPVLKDGVIVGIAYFQCDTYILQSIVDGVNIGEYGEAYILDKEGTTIAYVNDELLLEQENAIRESEKNPNDTDLKTVADIERKMIAGESGIVEYYYEEDDSNNVQGYAPIQGTDGWSIAVNLDKDEFMQTAYEGNNTQIVVSAALCVIVILISAGISRSISKPVVKCAKRLRALSEGDLNSAVSKVGGRDEVRILADSTAQLVENFRVIVDEMGRVLGSIANGDLTQNIESDHYPGDFKKLQNYLETIDQKLNNTMGGIVNAANYVSAESAQVAASSAELSRGTAAQSSAVEQLFVTIEDIDRDAKQTAQLAEQTKNAVNSAEVELQKSNQHIEELNEAMNQITTSSREIAHIIDTIENIAFQTNILALNASVEASHAGEMGRGFAIVAEEVRALATKANESAKATMELLERSITAVESGSEIVQKVTGSVANVVELSEQAAEQMDIVAESVERQMGAIEQVTQAVGQISNVVHTNSTTAQESETVSRELSGQANILNRLVGGFSLRN